MIGRRLKLARTAAGFSLRELADKAGNVVTAQAIGKYERDAMMPGSKALLALAAALGVTEDYLLSTGGIELEGIEFRKAITSEREEAALEARLLADIERYLEIEDILAEANTRWRPPEGFPYCITDIPEAEEAAAQLRARWDLGSDPIPDLAEFLEEHGIKVFALALAENISGVMCWVRRREAGDVPVIVVNAEHDGERQRFTLCHELGHLVLVVAEGVDFEKVCHRFAGAFLMPAESLSAKVGRQRRSISVAELFVLKKLFRASAQAIIYRCKDLGIVTAAGCSEVFRTFTRNGWRKREPAPLPRERPRRFERLCYRALAEGCLSEEKTAELLGTTVRDLGERLRTVPELAPPWR
jgi:Zn-dependent peptidase ImmA (M78 family)